MDTRLDHGLPASAPCEAFVAPDERCGVEAHDWVQWYPDSGYAAFCEGHIDWATCYAVDIQRALAITDGDTAAATRLLRIGLDHFIQEHRIEGRTLL